MFIVIDDCDDDLMVSCFLFGVIIVFIGFENELLKGVIIVICVMEDDKGNFVNCIYNIIVEDQELLVISCLGVIISSVVVCVGGISVQFFDFIVIDNCLMVIWMYSYQSGDFFFCGIIIVMGMVIDMVGN